MNNEYQILNGDCLKEQFPNSINGKIIVARLCLVVGDVKAKNLDNLFKIRAKFISNNYPNNSEKDYYYKTVTEIEKIKKIPENAIINLWFEDDLFCQVNFWFIMNLIFNYSKAKSVFLIRPKTNSKYNFGNMSKDELIHAFNKKIKIEPLEMKELSGLWNLYQDNKCDDMLKIAKDLKEKFSFLIPAITTHKERITQGKNPGRPIKSLIRIMKELKTDKFEPIFKAFCEQESIYGFGDLQVKSMYDEIINNK